MNLRKFIVNYPFFRPNSILWVFPTAFRPLVHSVRRTHLKATGLRPNVAVVAGDARLGHALRGQELVVHIILPAHGALFVVGAD